MDDIYPILEVIDQPGKMVIATIVHVRGSAYKREGAAMIFFENGSPLGSLSAGCLEADLEYKVQEIMREQKASVVQYDLSEEDDMGWGQGAGCNGMIDILLEPATEKLKEDLLTVKKLLAGKKTVIALKKLDAAGEYVFIADDTEAFGQWSGDIPDVDVALESGMMPALPVFQHTYQPKPRLFVFGAGADAKPLVSLAAETGFSVAVCDWREEFCQKRHFPAAEQLLLGFPAELLDQISLSASDFAVIMSHHFHRDQEILSGLLHMDLRYLGVLGARERTRRLLNGKKAPDWLYSPMGKTIGAKGPVEIAVSVVAQMIEVWRRPGSE